MKDIPWYPAPLEGKKLTVFCEGVFGVKRIAGFWSWRFPFYHRGETDRQLRARVLNEVSTRQEGERRSYEESVRKAIRLNIALYGGIKNG